MLISSQTFIVFTFFLRNVLLECSLSLSSSKTSFQLPHKEQPRGSRAMAKAAAGSPFLVSTTAAFIDFHKFLKLQVSNANIISPVFTRLIPFIILKNVFPELKPLWLGPNPNVNYTNRERKWTVRQGLLYGPVRAHRDAVNSPCKPQGLLAWYKADLIGRSLVEQSGAGNK